MGKISSILNKYAKEQLDSSELLQAPTPFPRKEVDPKASGPDDMHEGQQIPGHGIDGRFSAGVEPGRKGAGIHQLPGHTEPWMELTGLDPGDFEALRTYDTATGHLLKYDEASGSLDGSSANTLHKKGSLQRLLLHGLIFPGGKLTPKGLYLCQELAHLSGAARDAHIETGGSIAADPGDQRANGHAARPLASSVKHSNPKHDENRTREIVRPQREPGPDESIVPVTRPESKKVSLDRALVSLLAPQSHEAERFRMLKTCILFPTSGNPPRSILVTSTGPGEGKSFVTANLAISIAQNVDSSVLLIDCDLRKPSIHQLFGFENAPGLADYLRGSGEYQSWVQTTEVDGLYILPSGSTEKNPSELLSSGRMNSLMKDLSTRRDLLVLLDSPPAAMTADPAILGKLVDGIVLVVRYGKTRLSEVPTVIEKLGKERFIGHVVNFYEHSLREYYGYRKYSYESDER